MTSFGLTPQGFRPKQQQDIIAELNAQLQDRFGTTINLGAESVFGQIVAIFSRAHANLWLLAEAVYASQYPGGAEGTSVDNILALSNLQRLPATATVTDPTPTTQTDGRTLYGLILFGAAGTVIPAGSLVKSATTPQYSFALDQTVTINAAANGQQNLVFSNAPTQGAYRLALTNPDTGSVLTTASLPYNVLGAQSQITWPATPSSGTFYVMRQNRISQAFAFNVSAATLQAGLRSMATDLAAVTVTGSVAAGFTITWGSAFQAPLSLSNTLLTMASTPSAGTFTLTVGGTATSALAYNATAAQVQAAINAAGYPLAQVASLTVGGAPAWAVNWVGSAVAPSVSVSANSTGVTMTLGNTQTLDVPPKAIDSLQATLAALRDSKSNAYPYSDVTVTGAAPVYTITFGGTTPQAGAPSSGSKAQPIIGVPFDTLQAGSAVTNVSTAMVAVGSPAQAIASATCTQTGPVEVLAGQLSVIGSPIAGWTGVTNQLDCLTGTNVETDTEALARRAQLLANQANGPLQSIVQKVSQTPGVTQAIGFQNLTDAALQNLTFSSVPNSGSYQLVLAGGTTAAIAYNATAAGVQAAINALTGYSQAQVTGSAAYGFVIDFAGAFGGQAQPLAIVVNNSTGVTITPSFGRAPKSFEVVVSGGSSAAIAKAIYGAMPAGVASYGTPAAITTGSVTQGSSTLTVAAASGILAGQSIFGLGIANGTTVASITGTAVTLSQPAIGSYASTPLTFSAAVQINDDFGNPILVSFSRPVTVLFYVSVSLTTDQYRTPGQPLSGVNPQARFNPGMISQIQEDIVTIGNRTPIGGLVIGFGSNGLMGAFNEIPGIVGYTLSFGPAPNPSSNANVQLLPTQAALFESFNVAVSYT